MRLTLIFFVLLLFASYSFAVTDIGFSDPTPANDTIVTDVGLPINVSTNFTNLDTFTWNWNGTNQSIYDSSVLLMFNFDNISILGDNDTGSVDISNYGNNGTFVNDANFTGNGKFNSGLTTGTNGYLSVPDNDMWAFGTDNFTLSLWIKPTSFPGQWYEHAFIAQDEGG
ncbi:hypothetical protein HZC07_04830, partial [Candidatus Micrarchaeota archaeon]|nr:hypothetical protein [Candidatus Micrarchaeota archaeon]